MQTSVKEQQKIFAYFNKILLCITSCIHEEQLKSCINSITIFEDKFSTHVAKDCLVEELYFQIDFKQNSLITL